MHCLLCAIERDGKGAVQGHKCPPPPKKLPTKEEILKNMALEMRALGEHEAKKRLALEAGDHEKAREHHETCDFFFKELKPKMLWYRAGCPELKEISVD